MDDESDPEVDLMEAVQDEEMSVSGSDERLEEESGEVEKQGQEDVANREEPQNENIKQVSAEHETGSKEDQVEEEEEVGDTAVIENKESEMEGPSTSVAEKRPASDNITSDAKKARVEHADTPGINTLPQRLNTQFVGREKELEILNSAMRTKVNSLVVDVAITGLPGVGKSELVRQFIKQNVNNFNNMFWLSVNNKQSDPESYQFANKFNAFYEFLNENKTLVIFDGVFISDLSRYLPSKENRSNIMIIATSQIADIPCGLNIPLQCFTPQNSLQYLQNNIPDENIEDLKSLSEILFHIPLALETAVEYFKHHTKIWEIHQKKFTVQNLILHVEKKTYKFLHFKTESDFKNSDTKSRLHSMFDKWVNVHISSIYKEEFGLISIQLLKFMSYMDHLDIDIRMFYYWNYDKTSIDSAMKLLQKKSLVKIVNDSVFAISPIFQSTVRDLYDKDTTLNDFLCFLEKSVYSDDLPINDEIEYIIKNQIMKLFNDHVVDMDDLLKRYHCMLLESANKGSPNEEYETLIRIYNAVMKCIEPADKLNFQAYYLNELCNLDKYEDVVNVSDEIIKNNYDKSFDCSKEGLLIWYFRALAFFHLKQLEKSWKICKNTFYLLSEKFNFSDYTLKSLELLTLIAIEIKKKDSNSNKLDLCLDIVEHLYGTFIDWTELEHDDQVLNVLNVISQYYIANKNPDFAFKYLENIKLKLEKQHIYNQTNDVSLVDNILICLKFKISGCLYEMNDFTTAYNILYALLPQINDNDEISKMILLLTKISCKKLEGEIKLNAIFNCMEFIHANILKEKLDNDGIFKNYITCFQNLGSQLCNSELISQYMRLLSHFEECMPNDDEFHLCLVKLQRAMVTCQYLELDVAWDIYLDVCQSLKLTQVQNKPAEKTEMLQIIKDTIPKILQIQNM